VQEDQEMDIDDRPIRQPSSADDERPLGGGNKGYNLDNLDEIPIGGGNNQFNGDDERPLGGGNKGYNLDDIPIGGKGNKGYAFDEQPIGGGNKGYNLDVDMNDESAHAGGDALIIMDTAPKKKKAPPARFA
jgi:hypothetical protein